MQKFSNFQINRTLAKKAVRMRPSSSEEDMQQEWLEIQAAQKDRAQFRPLYQRYYEPVFRFIYKRTADQSLSADICSVVFLKAMERLDRYTFQGVPFSAWLFRIASNEVAQHFRKNQRNRVVSAEEYHFKDLVEEMDEDWAQDLLPNLISHLDQLKEKDLVLIEMRFFEKRPFKEIAEILEITESNAKVRTYRILDRLKKKILENS